MCICCVGTPTYVCFDCRFVTKRIGHLNHRTPLCSHCGTALIRFGKGDFPTPPRSNDRRWKKLKEQYVQEQQAEARRVLKLKQWMKRRREQSILG